MDKNVPHISVVIPVYLAENCLNELYYRLKKSLEIITLDFEIIFIEDCGGDNSWNVIYELAQKDSRVIGFRLSRNFGQHYATTAGLDLCKGDWVVFMDCDLQDHPEEINSLYKKAQEGYDVVLAKRENREDPFFKKICSVLFYVVLNYLADSKLDPRVANFRIISRKAADSIKQMRESLRFISCLNDWVGFKTTSINVKHSKAYNRKSAYNFKKLLSLAKDVIIAYSDKPLKMSVNMGFFISFIAIIFGFYYIFRKIKYGIPILGWASLIVIILFLGGIVIANLGIIGIYLGKTFEETKKRPLYIIAEKTDFKKSEV